MPQRTNLFSPKWRPVGHPVFQGEVAKPPLAPCPNNPPRSIVAARVKSRRSVLMRATSGVPQQPRARPGAPSGQHEEPASPDTEQEASQQSQVMCSSHLGRTPTDSNPLPSPDRHSLLSTQTGATSSPPAPSSTRARAAGFRSSELPATHREDVAHRRSVSLLHGADWLERAPRAREGWSGARDSNPGPHGPEPCALPDCASPRLQKSEPPF